MLIDKVLGYSLNNRSVEVRGQPPPNIKSYWISFTTFLFLSASVSDTAQQPSEEQSKSLDKPKQKKNRCFMCRKKVGLTGFECRCGNVYCGVHRYSDVHNCSYNYKADAAEKIRKENPVVVGEKIQKIWTPAGIQNPLTICKLKIDLRFFFPSRWECRAMYLA